jgi:protein-S-isoprenylcysteine O-methyltransferase Ste14
MPSPWLTIRSLLWTLAVPVFLAGYVPWRFFGLRDVVLDLRRPLHLIGVIAIGLGAVLMAASIVEFARRGRGTLSPLDPPRRLVVHGPYRYVRNPMYLCVTLIVFGELALTRSRGLFLLWVVWFTVINLVVWLYEEPTLRRQFGREYERYAAGVRRWMPRLTPWQPAD